MAWLPGGTWGEGFAGNIGVGITTNSNSIPFGALFSAYDSNPQNPILIRHECLGFRAWGCKLRA